MAFDIQATLKGMATAATDSLESDLGDMEDHVKKVLNDRKEFFEDLYDAIERQIKREKKALEAGMIAGEVMAKAAAEKAINAALGSLFTAVKGALPI